MGQLFSVKYNFKDIEIWHSRVPNLTWTHYRELLTVSDETARHWYMQEASSVSLAHRKHIRQSPHLPAPPYDMAQAEQMDSCAAHCPQREDSCNQPLKPIPRM